MNENQDGSIRFFMDGWMDWWMGWMDAHRQTDWHTHTTKQDRAIAKAQARGTKMVLYGPVRCCTVLYGPIWCCTVLTRSYKVGYIPQNTRAPKMTISTSVWSGQHPNTGQNIQHPSSCCALEQVNMLIHRDRERSVIRPLLYLQAEILETTFSFPKFRAVPWRFRVPLLSGNQFVSKCFQKRKYPLFN